MKPFLGIIYIRPIGTENKTEVCLLDMPVRRKSPKYTKQKSLLPVEGSAKADKRELLWQNTDALSVSSETRVRNFSIWRMSRETDGI